MIRRRTKTISFVLQTLALLALNTACDEPVREKNNPDSIRWTDTPKPAVGPTFEDEAFTFTAKAPQICDASGPMAPPPGKKRLSIFVTIQGKSARQVPISALLFTLEDAEGHEARPTLAGCRPTIPRRQVVRDERAEGEVAFDVPLDFRAKELRFEPFLIGREKVIGRVLLPSNDAAP